MTYMEAKAIAYVNTMTRIFEEAYDCKVPQDVIDEHKKEMVEQFNLLNEIIKSI